MNGLPTTDKGCCSTRRVHGGCSVFPSFRLSHHSIHFLLLILLPSTTDEDCCSSRMFPFFAASPPLDCVLLSAPAPAPSSGSTGICLPATSFFLEVPSPLSCTPSPLVSLYEFAATRCSAVKNAGASAGDSWAEKINSRIIKSSI
jgi:hypothetical protein